jgi:hypothetical protein
MTEKAFRYDHGELKSPVELPNGFWRFEGYIARAGIYEYINTPKDEKLGYGKAGAVRRELRPEEEVARDDVLGAFTGMSLTATHPKQDVTIDNARSYEVGTVVEQPRWDAATKRVAASIVVKDRGTVDKLKRRELNELSPGYKAMIYKTPGADKRYAYPGNPEGKYDVVQRDIEPNHLALVKFARGGGDLQVRLDAADDCAVEVRHDFGAKLTSVVNGHQHLLDPSGGMFGPCGDGASGATSWAVSEGADVGHEHAWLKAADGTITIAMAEGHTHSILDDARYAAARTERADEAQIDRSVKSGEGDVMAEKNASAMPADEQIRLLKTQLDEALVRENDLKSQLATTATRADSADAIVQARTVRIAELESQLASGAQAMETAAIAEQAQRADTLEEELATLKASREAEIQKEAEVRSKALVMMGPQFRCDGQDARQIQSAVIKKFAPDEDVSEAKSNAYIATRFDTLYDDRAKSARSYAAAGAVLAAPATAAHEVRTDAAAPKKLSHRDSWRKGLPE